MSRAKLLTSMLLISLSALQALSPFETWYSPFLAALVIIVLTALLQMQKPEQGDGI